MWRRCRIGASFSLSKSKATWKVTRRTCVPVPAAKVAGRGFLPTSAGLKLSSWRLLNLEEPRHGEVAILWEQLGGLLHDLNIDLAQR